MILFIFFILISVWMDSLYVFNLNWILLPLISIISTIFPFVIPPASASWNVYSIHSPFGKWNLAIRVHVWSLKWYEINFFFLQWEAHQPLERMKNNKKLRSRRRKKMKQNINWNDKDEKVFATYCSQLIGRWNTNELDDYKYMKYCSDELC